MRSVETDGDRDVGEEDGVEDAEDDPAKEERSCAPRCAERMHVRRTGSPWPCGLRTKQGDEDEESGVAGGGFAGTR